MSIETTKTVTINRRTRFQACVTTTPTHLTLEECHTVTAKQLQAEYMALRREVGTDASIFMTIYRNGKRISMFPSVRDDLNLLIGGYLDEIELEVANG